MLRSLFSKLFEQEEPQEETRPLFAPRPVFAVGDVHGMSGMLDTMIAEIADQIAQDRLDDAVVIFLGAYIDRGPDSKGTLDLLLDSPARLGVETVFLRGNHEAFAHKFLDKPYEDSRWLEWGGEETIESYGIDPQEYATDMKGQIALSKALSDAMGESHLTFLRERLVTSHAEMPFFFSHAGIDIARPPEDQPEKALVHGLRGFRETGGWPDTIAVHGHYITEEPDLGIRRIGVDTGAYRTGVLTALFAVDETIDFIEIED